MKILTKSQTRQSQPTPTGVEIFECNLPNGVKLAIFRNTRCNSSMALRKPISQYVGHEEYSEYKDKHTDNKSVRIIVKGLNELDFKDYEG